ncbi:TIGR01212 family radical SAM protein [Clostridium formicaceticum]|uniref:Coproporphyrinogen III oxidase n=1 Tax=Clostridium formicaceticum TaxID=1497 RepID=A0AAC9RNC5_9CLOT|nr:TIGR01212 family radical SAM protein [Clostridium formicaceticum]AOY78097.1 TIGR01212 family radical SAM protein [Clostridium formicaceticum]ARE88747.1 coproporphyrinogen III oxidase [Clostridium formicaceticum]
MKKDVFLYRTYSDYLREKYGEKVYKLPINLPLTCPNRDGRLGQGGCTFCAEVGTGFENLPNSYTVAQQLESNKKIIRKKYKAKKFIAYFQNFTNTYLPLEDFKKYVQEAVGEDIVEIAISTRPDCIDENYLIFLKEIKDKYAIEISIELGLQTVNYHSLKKINRGHTLAEFIDAVFYIQKYGFEICTHLILNLPWDDEDDVIENAKIISALRIQQVKLHALYLVKGTKMGEMYEKGEFQIIPVETYQKRVVTFLEYLAPNIIVQRLIGRAPEENSVFVNWNRSWWKIRDEIHEMMEKDNSYQGKRANYLGGKALDNSL